MRRWTEGVVTHGANNADERDRPDVRRRVRPFFGALSDSTALIGRSASATRRRRTRFRPRRRRRAARRRRRRVGCTASPTTHQRPAECVALSRANSVTNRGLPPVSATRDRDPRDDRAIQELRTRPARPCNGTVSTARPHDSETKVLSATSSPERVTSGHHHEQARRSRLAPGDAARLGVVARPVKVFDDQQRRRRVGRAS
jgi:hypothetical protein